MQPDGRRWEPLAFVDATGMALAVLALAHGEHVSEIVNLAVDSDLRVGGSVSKSSRQPSIAAPAPSNLG